MLQPVQEPGIVRGVCFIEQPTSAISVAVLPFAPRYSRARADDMLQGEKKMFLPMFVSFSLLKKSTVNSPTDVETSSIATTWKEATDRIVLFECLKLCTQCILERNVTSAT